VRYRVLPPLLTELRTPQLQSLVLPLILELAERQAGASTRPLLTST